MEKVITLTIPHIGEKILENFDTDGMIQQCLWVSQTWKVLAENVLVKRWRHKVFEACEIGKKEIVELLLERLNEKDLDIELNCHENDEYGWTAFSVACSNGHTDIVKLLLTHPGSKVINWNATRDTRGGTAFHVACFFGFKDIVQLLVDHSSCKNIDLNIKDENGHSAFMRACQEGHQEVVKLLLDHSERNHIDLNIKDENGSTALLLACDDDEEQDRTEVIGLLLDHSSSKNIDFNARNNGKRY